MTGSYGRLRGSGLYDIPPHFKPIGYTFFQLGFIQKKLKVHDCRSGSIIPFEEFLKTIPNLEEAERSEVLRYLRKEGLIDEV